MTLVLKKTNKKKNVAKPMRKLWSVVLSVNFSELYLFSDRAVNIKGRCIAPQLSPCAVQQQLLLNWRVGPLHESAASSQGRE